MSRHHAKRTDSNQPELVKFLRKCGASFQHTHQIAGALDGIVGYCGIDQRVEIKDPTKPKSDQKLTEAEQKTFDNWKGRPPVVLRTTDDCLDLLKVLAQNRRAGLEKLSEIG